MERISCIERFINPWHSFQDMAKDQKLDSFTRKEEDKKQKDSTLNKEKNISKDTNNNKDSSISKETNSNKDNHNEKENNKNNTAKTNNGNGSRVTAEELAKKQRDISVAEFFEKNRHLLGFDNPRKALMTTIKEAVDNALDACEEARILPDINIEVIEMEENRFRVIVEDNGPGIVKEQIPNIFAKLLYGSKFHRLRQSRGQQGIGISAAVLYSQLTTGRATKIVSRTAPDKPAHYFELKINTQLNKPEILKDDEKEWSGKEHGTKIELDLEANYQKGNQSVDEYIKQTAIANPHVQLIYSTPKAEPLIFPRGIDHLPKEPVEIKPHPYGLEIGILMKMLTFTKSRTLQQFLTTELSRVGSGTAKEICENALILPNTNPTKMNMQDAEKLIAAIKKTRIMNPSTDCISPIGDLALEKSIKKEINAEFYCAITRPPSVYRGNPFQIEVAIAYGGNQPGDRPVSLLRFANRVPLLYQQGGCAMTKSVMRTNWKAYGLQQSAENLPTGPLTVLVHMASVWVPFTSESKEAIAHYPEIIAEIKLALQEAGRKLWTYVHKKIKVGDELKKRGYIEKYIPMVAQALQELLELKKSDEEQIEVLLKELLEKHRGQVEDMEFDENKNVEYDEQLAKIGSKRKTEDALYEDEESASTNVDDESEKNDDDASDGSDEDSDDDSSKTNKKSNVAEGKTPSQKKEDTANKKKK
jgi:DNA topoisomerase VI subunit B